MEPRIHYLYHAYSTTWQYLIADPDTLHCIIIDPVMDGESSSTKGGLSTVTADGIIEEIKRNKYKVDQIVETKCSPRDNRSASWYMRMQLLEAQGYAPKVSSGQDAVQRMGGLFARKYGRGIQSTLNDGDEMVDGQPIFVGNMSVIMKQLPGLCAPDGKLFIVGDKYVFGAHEIVQLKLKMQSEGFDQQYPLQRMTEDECHQLWISVQKVLSMPSDMQIYFCRGTAHTNQQISNDVSNKEKSVRFGSEGSRPSSSGPLSSRPGTAEQEEPLQPFTAAAIAKNAYKDVAGISKDFMERWAAKKQEAIVIPQGAKR